MKRWLRFLILVILVLLLAACAVWFWPPPALQTAPQESALDLAMPQYHHREVHEVKACADPASLDRALREVRAEEIRGFELLMGIREMRHQSNRAAKQMPLLEVMEKANFVALADLPQQEIVYGTAGPFWELRGARGELFTEIRRGLRGTQGAPDKFAALSIEGAAKAAVNFRIVPVLGEECPKLVTETRVLCPDGAALQAFTRYWRVIQPGSAYLRKNWLQAVVRRAGAMDVKGR